MIIAVTLQAQDTLNYRYCLEQAVANSPRLRDRQYIDQEGRLVLENIRTGWYPSLTINGKASYQSDVVSIEIDQPGLPLAFPAMPHEQFGINLDIRQTIYDGGYSRERNKLEQVSTNASLQKVNIDLHALKEQLTDLFFSILLLQENRNNLLLAIDDLHSRENVLQSAVQNGVAEETDLNIISVEILRLLQSVSEIDAARNGSLELLLTYIGYEPDMQVWLQIPYLEIKEDESLSRPELELFDLQTDLLDAGKNLAAARRFPVFFAFGQAGAGMPGYNMLNDQVDTYYMVGAGVHWNIWDWNYTKREKEILETRKNILMNSRETFTMILQAAMEREIEQMKHFHAALEMDEKMLRIRAEISSSASSKLDNGVLSATDYLQVLNDENRTRVNHTTHRIQLVKAMAKYNLLKGAF